MSLPRASTLDFERPLVTVDVAIFSVINDQLCVLLVRRPDGEDEPFPGRWALPGGFVDVQQDASLQACAERKLLAKTGVASPYLEQLGSWGDAKRDPRGWSSTHAYFSLITQPASAGAGHTPTDWLPCEQAVRRRLAFDHNTLLNAAIERLRSKVEYTSLPAFLLPEPFTLPQLQRVYEVVLGRALDKSAFRKRMLDADYLDEAGPVTGEHGRPAMGYRLRSRDHATVFPRGFKSGE